MEIVTIAVVGFCILAIICAVILGLWVRDKQKL
ncbi:MAG: hypothetical protein ACI9TY_001255 [Alphaproteobacteria bacterium]|jgi:hypothetical protein